MGKLLDRIELELLHTPATTFFEKFKNIVFGAFIYIAWSTFILWLYEIFIPEFRPSTPSFHLSNSLIFTFIGSCIIAPFVEEAIYRLPLRLLKNVKIEGMMIIGVLFSSVLFGRAHWGGSWTVPKQGVAGLAFCYVYLKNGYSYLSSVATHFIVNFFFLLN